MAAPVTSRTYWNRLWALLQLRLGRGRSQAQLFIFVVLITLVAGLFPEDYTFRNKVRWANGESGLTFAKYSVAFSEPVITRDWIQPMARGGFTWELTLANLPRSQETFSFIASFHAGDDRTQLVLGQWSNMVIVMNGDDYSHRFGSPRISFRLPADPEGEHRLTITSSPLGTFCFFDGQLMAGNPDMSLRIPTDPTPARLLVGNSVYGTHSWRGTVRGLSLRAGVFPPVLETATAPQTGRQGPLSTSGELVVGYSFGEMRGDHTLDHSPRHLPLRFPAHQVIVQKRFLQSPAVWSSFDRDLVSDIVVNLLGFIPFGFAFSLCLRGRDLNPMTSAVLVVTSAALLSFMIEYGQTWLPSRTSSALDWILNILGAIPGILLAARFTRATPVKSQFLTEPTFRLK